MPHADAPYGKSLSTTFPERKLWRDSVDLLWGVALVPVGIVYTVVPSLLAYWCLGLIEIDQDDRVVFSLLTGLACLIDWLVLMTLPAFRSVTVDDDGLLFRRYAGPDKRVFWPQLVRMFEVPRPEVFFRVWVWPGFPPRGSLMCGTTLHQFKIEWTGGRYYFAPADVPGFVAAIRQVRPELGAPRPCELAKE